MYAAVSLLISCSSSCTDKIWKLFNGDIMLTGSTVSSLSVLFVLSTRTSSSSAFPEPRGEGSRHLASLPFYLPAYHPVCSMTVVVAGFRAWKFWHVSFPYSLSNVQPLRRIVREDLLSFCCCTNTCSLFVRRGFLVGFILFSSLSSTKLLYCCTPLVMAELRTVMAAASTMTLESRAKRHPPSSSNWCPASSDVWPFILEALCGAGWQVLLHLHFLLPSHCTAHVLGHGLWLRKDDTFSAQQISHCLRFDTCHEGTLITTLRSWCGQGQNKNNMVTALSVFV